MSPPRRAISFTIRELKYVYSSFGIKKIVSTLASSFRFISAIWNSNSKSETARKPRMTARRLLRDREIDEQTVQRRDLHASSLPLVSSRRCEAFLESEERLLLLVVRDRDDHFVE